MADPIPPRRSSVVHDFISPRLDVDFDPRRFDVVAAIAALPDEAFDFVCGTLDNIGRTAGGFRQESREALVAIVPIVEAYFASKGGA